MDTATLKRNRNEYEYRVLRHLADMLPAGTKACIVSDRGFDETKDPRFGMGMGEIGIASPVRRDRPWLLTVLGAASEALGYDRMLR